MKKNIFLLVVICVVNGCFVKNMYAADAKVMDVDLWPDGLPNTNGMDQQPFNDEQRNFKPSMRVFLPEPDKATGRAVLICPGGGYHVLALGHEGYEWANWFNEQGIAVLVMKYRMPEGNREVPYSDVEQGMRIIKTKAKEWNINPDNVGIMGSSAGGHLASTFATKSGAEVRPAFQVLFYPVITMDKSYTHMGSHDGLLGKEASEELEILYSNEKQVHKDTPRAFITFSHDDEVVPSENGVHYYLALKKENIPAALYIYPTGGHGWGIRKNFKYHTEMLGELAAWLKSF